MTEIAFRPTTVTRTTLNRLAAAWKRLVDAFCRWRQRRRSRARLADLDDWMLRDIGLTPSQAGREVRRSFPWHLSEPWRHAPRDGWR